MDALRQMIPLLGPAIAITLLLGAVSFAIGTVLGMLTALARLSRYRALRWVTTVYISVFRGTPLLVQVLLIYFGLPQFGINIPPIPSAIAAFSLHVGAYLGETFRAGILAIDRGQREAAHALGMSPWQAFRRVTLPQAVRVVVPPVMSQFISLIKDTSLASTVTVVELTRVAETVGSATFMYMTAFVIIAAIYWVICSLLALAQEMLERRLARGHRPPSRPQGGGLADATGELVGAR